MTAVLCLVLNFGKKCVLAVAQACTELPTVADGGLPGFIYIDDGEVRSRVHSRPRSAARVVF